MERVHPSDYYVEYSKISEIIAHLSNVRHFFTCQNIDLTAIVLHIPLPLQTVLVASMHSFSEKPPVETHENDVFLLGMRVIPGYEYRIIASIAADAIFETSPMVIIDGLAFKREITYTEIY